MFGGIFTEITYFFEEYMSNVVLIGPIGSGKSTQATLLAERLGTKPVDLDQRRQQDYAELSFSYQAADDANARCGIMGWYAYQKPYELCSVIKALNELDNVVIAFGGGQSVFEDPSLFKCVKDIMARHKVVLLMESADVEETLVACERRKGVANCPRELNRHFVTHPSNSELANLTVYTKGKSKQQINDEIYEWLVGSN
jgi:shikimate kinase